MYSTSYRLKWVECGLSPGSNHCSSRRARKAKPFSRRLDLCVLLLTVLISLTVTVGPAAYHSVFPSYREQREQVAEELAVVSLPGPLGATAPTLADHARTLEEVNQALDH